MDPFDAMDRLFDDSRNFSGFGTDIQDAGDHYLLEADLPGFRKEDIHVDITNGSMTISAERNTQKNEKGEDGYIRRERSYGSYRRSFDLDGIDESGIKGRYQDGVLTISLPKQQEKAAESRRLTLTD